MIMSIVYITESNLNSIARDVTDAVSDTRSLESIYDFELRSFLALPEVKRLSSLKLILESLEHQDILFRIIQFNEQPKTRQRKNPKERWIYLGGSPAYHKTKSCKRLKSEYRNYNIPLQIPTERIEEYRKFFVENIELFERNQEAFYANVELKFNVRINGVRKVQAKNSGSEEVDNFEVKSPSQLLNQIHLHVEKMVGYRSSAPEIEMIIAKCGFNTHKTLENPSIFRLSNEQIEIVQTWHSLKAELKKLVVHHLTAKLSADFGFSGELLDSFGFRKCADCFPEALRY